MTSEATPRSEDILWVEGPDLLPEIEQALGRTDLLALDTESNSMFAYRERLCLVQLGFVIDGHLSLAAIDPLAFERPEDCLASLERWLRLPHKKVLLHGGEYDVAVLKRELGVGPTHLFDTQTAASLLGMTRTGYANLVGELLEVELDKSHQQFDWGRRPVPAGPRRYALDDVRYLPELAAIISSMVADADLVEEVELACRAVADSKPHNPAAEADRFWRLVGAERLAPEVLRRLLSLFRWRERESETRDIPPGRLVPNSVLLDLACRPPVSISGLNGLGLGKKLIAECPDAILAAASDATPDLPEKPKKTPPDPAVRAREAKLKTWRENEASRRSRNIQAVLPTRVLELLASGVRPEDIPLLGDKRLRLYGDALRSLLR